MRPSLQTWQLLWEIVESPEPVITGKMLYERYPSEAEELVKTRLLDPAKGVGFVQCPACDEEHDHLEVEGVDGRFFVVCPFTGEHEIPKKNILLYRLNMMTLALAAQDLLGLNQPVQNIMPDCLWDLGTGYFGARRQRIYLVRRLATHRKEITARLKQAPGDHGGLVISPADCEDVYLPGGFAIVSFTHLVSRDEKDFAVSVLNRLVSGEEPVNLPHAPDFRWVVWKGEKHLFRGKTQRKIVAHLYPLHMAGRTPVSTSDFFSGLGIVSTRQFSEIFKGHKTWKSMIHYEGGMCSLKD